MKFYISLQELAVVTINYYNSMEKKIVTCLVVLTLMLASFTVGVQYPRGDVDLNGKVNIADVTTLIDYLLSGTWGNESDFPVEPQDEIFTVNGVSFMMIAVEGGTFTMGSNSSNYSMDKPPHGITVSSFSIGQTEVTQDLWQAVMGSNPSTVTGNLQLPVETVTWNDCQDFINKLNELTGRTFRLPTEAEWEFAARGGNNGKGYTYSGHSSLDVVGWYKSNSSSTTHPVATKLRNELGLYDMSGNVAEWCQDWFDEHYYNSSPVVNPTGPSSGTLRVNRGGGYTYDANRCCVYNRSFHEPANAVKSLGLRLAL